MSDDGLDDDSLDDLIDLMKAVFPEPAPAAVLTFPALMRCERCVHFAADAEGRPVCMEYEETIPDQSAAEFCAHYEVAEP